MQVDHLAGIEEKYRSTVEENYRLYNEVQDLKGNIRVFCRVRPLGVTGDSSAGVHLVFLVICFSLTSNLTHDPMCLCTAPGAQCPLDESKDREEDARVESGFTVGCQLICL